MKRRRFLETGVAIAGTATLAGCSGLFETRPLGSPPAVLDDRPDAVYVPTHVEGMQMVGMDGAGRYRAALSYSFPHRFWIVTGQDREKVAFDPDDSVHLMVSLWDEETGTVVPNAGLRVAIERDGESVTSRSMWPMLSPNMGYHFGDNVRLPEEGTYTVEATVGPMSVRRTGEFRDTFGESRSLSFEFEFDRAALEEIRFEELDNAGDTGTVDPMEMEMMPSGQLPAPEDLPGEVVGEATSGDGVFVVTTLEEPPAGIDESGTYLAVSPRTPYNRFPLPFMSVAATLERDGETMFDGDCSETFDPELKHHYGAVVDGVESGDELTISVGTPPQVSRHEGYETAFFEMGDATLTV